MSRRFITRGLCVAALSLVPVVIAQAPVASATGGEKVWTSGGSTYHLSAASLRVTKMARPATDPDTAATESQIVPIVDCQIVDKARKTRVVWFGYLSKIGPGTWMPVGADNHITQISVVRGRLRTTTVADMGQVNHFQSGEHHMAFAIDIPLTTTISWDLTTPAGTAANGSFTESITPLIPRNCPAGTPKRSAVARIVTEPSYTVTGVNEVKDALGTLIAGGVRYDVIGIESRCSAGGTPQAPSVLWGWADNTSPRSDGVTSNLTAVEPLVRTDSLFGGFDPAIDFQRSFNPVRTVADTQRLPVAGPKAGTGMTETDVLADVFGVCAFGGTMVTSTTSAYVPSFGDFRYSFTVTDIPGQFQRPARGIGTLFDCEPAPSDGSVCFENGEVPFDITRPNSVRTR
jgi:hypothetical protein